MATSRTSFEFEQRWGKMDRLWNSREARLGQFGHRVELRWRELN